MGPNTRHKAAERDKATLRKALAPAGRLIDELHAKGFKGNEVLIEEYEFVSSYNWKDDEYHPTIYVPGSPPRWTAPTKFPTYIPKDEGKVYVDQNTYRCPGATFDPLFKALLTTHPNFDMSAINLVTDRNNLRKLLKFVSNEQDDSWRIDVDIFGETMFFSRWNSYTIKIVNPMFSYNRGHSFEKAFTWLDSDFQGSTSHHRIVRYSLGELDCLVRYEADAYVDGINNDEFDDRSAAKESIMNEEEDIMQADLVAGVGKISLEPSCSAAESLMKGEIKVIPRGRPVPLTSIAELKITSRPKLHISDIASQLWLSQTRKICVGYHKDGTIDNEIVPQDISSEIEAWRLENSDKLRTMLNLIKRVKESASSIENGKCMLVYENDAKTLKLYERKGKGFTLPDDMRKRYWPGSVTDEKF